LIFSGPEPHRLIWTAEVLSDRSMGLAQITPQRWEDFDPMDIQRRDIEIPRDVFDRWLKHPLYDGDFRESVKRIYYFRKKVLAVFDELIDRERIRVRMQ
jgi:hypothetical protein